MRRLRFLNVSTMDVSVIDIGSRGKETGKILIPGGKTNISDEAYFDQMEDSIFKDSYLIFVGTGDMPAELGKNPNHLTDKEVKGLVDLTVKESIVEIDEISSSVTLRRLYDAAQKRGLMDYLKKRLLKEYQIDIDRENQVL